MGVGDYFLENTPGGGKIYFYADVIHIRMSRDIATILLNPSINKHFMSN